MALEGPPRAYESSLSCLQAYSCQNPVKGDKLLRCMLLNEYFPFKLVCGSHLFKYSWRSDIFATLGFKNINNVRNGLLLLKWVKSSLTWVKIGGVQ